MITAADGCIASRYCHQARAAKPPMTVRRQRLSKPLAQSSEEQIG